MWKQRPCLLCPLGLFFLSYWLYPHSFCAFLNITCHTYLHLQPLLRCDNSYFDWNELFCNSTISTCKNWTWGCKHWKIQTSTPNTIKKKSPAWVGVSAWKINLIMLKEVLIEDTAHYTLFTYTSRTRKISQHIFSCLLFFFSRNRCTRCLIHEDHNRVQCGLPSWK